MIRSLEVTKTLTPDMDANSLGGTIEVKTLSAFDIPKKLLSVNGGAGYDQLSKQSNPFGSALWADRFMDGKLGVAMGFSSETRKFASDDVETGGGWSAGKLTSVELRDYLPVRERNALSLNLDYRANKDQTLYSKTFWSAFSDSERRDRLGISNITGGSAAEDTPFNARAERNLRQRKYTRDIVSQVIGGTHAWDNWKLEGRLGLSSANEDQPEALNSVAFRQNVTGLTFKDTMLPVITAPAGSSLYDPIVEHHKVRFLPRRQPLHPPPNSPNPSRIPRRHRQRLHQRQPRHLHQILHALMHLQGRPRQPRRPRQHHPVVFGQIHRLVAQEIPPRLRPRRRTGIGHQDRSLNPLRPQRHFQKGFPNVYAIHNKIGI
jgi:hypothetical protein